MNQDAVSRAFDVVEEGKCTDLEKFRGWSWITVKFDEEVSRNKTVVPTGREQIWSRCQLHVVYLKKYNIELLITPTE